MCCVPQVGSPVDQVTRIHYRSGHSVLSPYQIKILTYLVQGVFCQFKIHEISETIWSKSLTLYLRELRPEETDLPKLLARSDQHYTPHCLIPSPWCLTLCTTLLAFSL